jgi:peptide/nickel transport system ATP-binding protein
MTLIEISGLRTYFRTDDGVQRRVIKAVENLTLSIAEGETLGIVGESGSGKSVTSLSIMRLLPEVAAWIESGAIAFLGRDLIKLPDREMRRVRGKEIAMIFQEPGTSLNPVFRAGDQVAEAIMLHQGLSYAQARARTLELFKEVEIPDPERRIDSYPHELSGGQKQRVMIAMALSCNPRLLIADEPTTALDVTIQATILDLLRKLRDERGMAILFITHDLGVIAEIADHVAVMYRGRLVEYQLVEALFAAPQHPYTRGLLACRPRLDSPYRKLPTVSDFMRVTEHGDETSIEEHQLDEAGLAALRSAGRGRLLHPVSELTRLGYDVATLPRAADDSYVAEGTKPLLEVRDLRVSFPIRKGLLLRVVGHVHAVDGISFAVYPGQTLGLVGESGCGKTTAGRAILRLLPITAGEVHFDGADLAHIGGRRLRELRQELQIIFQDPYGSLNPRMSVEAILGEGMLVHGIGRSRSERRDRAAALLEEVGLEPEHLERYPHEFSGGQRQRIGIARALAVEPRFIICDESVSALDVSVQAQVLNLLKDLQRRRNLTYIFISHDLSVVKFMADMMAVMKDGKIVEFGPSDAIYAAPREQYTRNLIAAIPQDALEKIQQRQRERIAARSRRLAAQGNSA